MTAAYDPDFGIVLILPGQTVILPKTMRVVAIERYVRELAEVYE